MCVGIANQPHPRRCPPKAPKDVGDGGHIDLHISGPEVTLSAANGMALVLVVCSPQNGMSVELKRRMTSRKQIKFLFLKTSLPSIWRFLW